MSVPTAIPPSAEFGLVEALEIRRVTSAGALRPIICLCDDGATYVVKPFSTGGSWPQTAEWMCARLGRNLGLPIPNFRQVVISHALADSWNAQGKRSIEPGLGFGSQFVASAVECDATLTARLNPQEATRLLAFDWWIRNSDRVRNNPNLLWSHEDARHYLIDHEKAGHVGGSEDFWRDHILVPREPWITNEILDAMRSTLALVSGFCTELPLEWTSQTEDLDWFIAHLTSSIASTPTKEWRPHE